MAAEIAWQTTGLRELRDLCLRDTQITDDGFDALAEPQSCLRSLRSLDLSGTGLSYCVFDDLIRRKQSALVELRRLDLSGTDIDDWTLTVCGYAMSDALPSLR